MEEPLVGRWIVESEQVASKVCPGGIDLRVCWASPLNLVTKGGWTKADPHPDDRYWHMEEPVVG